MAVLVRDLGPCRIGGVPCLGAVRSAGYIVAGLEDGASGRDFGDAVRREVPLSRGLVLHLSPDLAGDTPPAETGLLSGRNVMYAVRRAETAAAVADWFRFHAALYGAEAALVIDTGAGGPGLAEALGRDFGAADPTLIVLRAADPEHRAGPLWPELARHRFLARARAVLAVEIADLVLPDAEGSAFDRAAARPGRVLRLSGRTIYPWRLRQGAPAPHADHVFGRAGTPARLTGWAAAPATLPDDAPWEPAGPRGMPADRAGPAFRRAMGVVHPGLPVARLVEKAALAEEPELSTLMRRAFGREPLGRPRVTSGRIGRDGSRCVTVVTAMKNEGAFVLDWIAYHRWLGVERFLVHTNDCDDGTDRLLDLLSEAGVTRRDNPYRTTGGVPQYAAFRAAEREDAVTGADWLMTLDVDEYLNIRPGAGRLSDLFDAAPDADAVSMPWRLFGNAGRRRFEDLPVTHQFGRAAPEFSPRPLQAWAFKTLYRNSGVFRRLGVHRPKGLDPAQAEGFRWLDGAGRALPPNAWKGAWRMTASNWGYALAGINHYAVRSAESFLVKRDRGRVNHVGGEQGAVYWFAMNHNAEEDRSIRRHDAPAAAERARLLTLPGVAEAHQASVAWHRDRIAALMADPAGRAFHDYITAPRMERLCRMQAHFGSAVFARGPEVIPDEVAARDPSEDFFFTV